MDGQMDPTRHKRYVRVLCDTDEQGTETPVALWLGDDRYDIDRVVSRREAASTRVGGLGVRFTIRVARGDGTSSETFLFHEFPRMGSPKSRWFVEAKNGV